MCDYCKTDVLEDSKTTFVSDDGDQLVIVRNVPCSECLHCGETFYDDAVAEKLMKFSDDAKKLKQETCISDYSKIV